MNLQAQVIELLDRTLVLQGRAADFTPSTALLGALPELDSMGVLNIITGLEEQFGFTVHDDEIDGSTFESLSTLTAFVAEKLGNGQVR